MRLPMKGDETPKLGSMFQEESYWEVLSAGSKQRRQAERIRWEGMPVLLFLTQQ